MGGDPRLDDGHVPPPRSEEAGDLVGVRLHGRYEVLSELGWGSLGRVYLARDLLRRGEEVALKVIRRDRLTPDAVRFLKREFRALAGLHHPHVARVYDLDVVPGRGELFFTLEHLPGRTLVAFTRAAGWEAALEPCVQALRALAFVHARGLIHMDVKPQNLLVLEGAAGPEVRLLDFHLARERDDPDDRAMRGTIAYMAPEVIRGEPVDPRADLYGLGAVLYEALTGAPPFHGGRGPLDVLRAHVGEPVPTFAQRGLAPGEVPSALEAIVRRLLAKTPGERFASANEVIRALGAALGRRFAVEADETLESYLRSARLVGRRRQVEAVLEAAPAPSAPPPGPADSHPGDEGPRAFCVVGEPGVGKSRLLATLKVSLQLEGLPCLLLRPHGPDDPPYAPFREALAELLRRGGREALLARLAGQDAPAPDAPPPASLDPARLAEEADELAAALPPRVRPTAALARLLRELAAEAPFALALDDLHRCDEPSRELVRALAADPGRALLIVASPAPDRALSAAGALTLELDRLTRADTRALLEAVFSGGPVPEPFVAKLWEATGGNPRLIEEALQGLTEGDAIAVREGVLAVREEAAAALLPGVETGALVTERVARLDGPAAELLGALATAPRGRRLPFAAATAGLSPQATSAALRELERRGLVTRREEAPGEGDLAPWLEVEHAPLAEAARARLGAARVRELHARATRMLESRHPATLERGAHAGSDRAEELLWHAEQAGELGAALRHATEAAAAARERREPARARRLYERALELREGLGAAAPARPSHLELTLRLAEALATIGEGERALALLAPLDRPFPRSAEGLRLRGAIRKDRGELGPALADLEAAVRCAQEAEAAGEEGAGLERARCLGERASVRLWSGSYAQARADGEAALALLGAAGDVATRVRVLDELFHACRFLGDEPAATAFLRDGLALRASDPRAAREGGAPPEALPGERALAGRRGPLLGDASGAHVARTIEEAALERAARADELRAHYQRRAALLEAAGDVTGAGYATLNLAHLRRASGRLGRALEGYAAAAARFARAGCQVGEALVALSRARLLAAAGAADPARAAAAAAEAQAAALGVRWVVAQARLAAAEAARAAGDLPGAAAELARAATLTEELGNVPQLAEQALLRAELALARGELTAARAALAAFEAAPAGARSGPTRLRALLAAGELELSAAPERAEALAAEALASAEARDLMELTGQAAWLRARARAARGDAEGELDDLVAALEVLRELAARLPVDLRAGYLARPEAVALRERFQARRS